VLDWYYDMIRRACRKQHAVLQYIQRYSKLFSFLPKKSEIFFWMEKLLDSAFDSVLALRLILHLSLARSRPPAYLLFLESVSTAGRKLSPRRKAGADICRNKKDAY
jgi:hypothetical protein